MPGVSSVTTVPEVDLGRPAGKLRERLREVGHEVGFCYLTGHQVPTSLISRVLTAARASSSCRRRTRTPSRWSAARISAATPGWAVN